MLVGPSDDSDAGAVMVGLHHWKDTWDGWRREIELSRNCGNTWTKTAVNAVTVS
jgi:hypothetical protein